MVIKKDFYYDSADKKSKIHAVKWVPDAEIRGEMCIRDSQRTKH